MSVVNILLDGREVKAEKGEYVLDVARREGIHIPTLCYNENLTRDGRCRLCVVEVSWNGRSRVVTSCLYPVDEGLKVRTDSEKVLLVRRMVLELLLSRNPEADVIRKLADEYGIKESRFPSDTKFGKCILCGICVRTCKEIVGVEALGFSMRGVLKQVGPSFGEPSSVCIGCGACAFACPTGHIELIEEGAERKIWGRTFVMEKCARCGRYFAPCYQLEWISGRTGVPYEELRVCVDCR